MFWVFWRVVEAVLGVVEVVVGEGVGEFWGEAIGSRAGVSC